MKMCSNLWENKISHQKFSRKFIFPLVRTGLSSWWYFDFFRTYYVIRALRINLHDVNFHYLPIFTSYLIDIIQAEGSQKSCRFLCFSLMFHPFSTKLLFRLSVCNVKNVCQGRKELGKPGQADGRDGSPLTQDKVNV